MKAAILGGSFNPVHLGHLFLADAVLAAGYDRIILVPAFQSPFKIGAGGASPKDRLEMLCASVAGDYRLTVDECEIRREGVSYTVDTIADIKKRYLPDGKPGLIIGDDLLETFHMWRNSSAIAQESEIIVARRLAGEASLDFPFPHTELNNDLMNISSRMVRERIQAGQNWQFLVPAGARFIIEDRKLYGYKDSVLDSGNTSVKDIRETIVFMENAARCTLDQERFLHSRHTALFARDLCLRYGIDADKGYLAGIVHDLCKSMDVSRLKRLSKTDGLEFSELEQKKPRLLHGRAAAVLLKTYYGINDEEILEAVRWHVTGGSGTGPLAKIIYIADKIEVSRYWVDPKLRDISHYSGLDELFGAVLDYTLANLNGNAGNDR